MALIYNGYATDMQRMYNERQEAHHRKKTFLEEYKEMLDKFQVEYDERYIFKELE